MINRRIVVGFAVKQILYWSVVVKSKAETLDLPVNLHSYSHLWSKVLSSDQKIEITDTSTRSDIAS